VTVNKITSRKLFNRSIDFLVLGLTFFLSCLMLSVDIGGNLLIQTLIYTTILVLSVRMAKRVAKGYKKSLNSITRQILSNAAGILVGTCVMLLLVKMFATGGDLIVVVIFSGVMAFFILGTLSPLVHRKSPSIH